MAAPSLDEIDWRALTPRAAAILRWIAVPVSLGYSHEEVAQRLNLRRPVIPHLALPGVVSAEWVSTRMRELRAELRGEEWSPSAKNRRRAA